MNTPKVGEKVKCGNAVGMITCVIPPNEHHSGRFTVHFHEKYREWDYEFWFGDYGSSVEHVRWKERTDLLLPCEQEKEKLPKAPTEEQ